MEEDTTGGGGHKKYCRGGNTRTHLRRDTTNTVGKRILGQNWGRDKRNTVARKGILGHKWGRDTTNTAGKGILGHNWGGTQ